MLLPVLLPVPVLPEGSFLDSLAGLNQLLPATHDPLNSVELTGFMNPADGSYEMQLGVVGELTFSSQAIGGLTATGLQISFAGKHGRPSVQINGKGRVAPAQLQGYVGGHSHPVEVHCFTKRGLGIRECVSRCEVG